MYTIPMAIEYLLLVLVMPEAITTFTFELLQARERAASYCPCYVARSVRGGHLLTQADPCLHMQGVNPDFSGVPLVGVPIDYTKAQVLRSLTLHATPLFLPFILYTFLHSRI